MNDETIEQTAERLMGFAVIQNDPNTGEPAFIQLSYGDLVEAIHKHTDPRDREIAELKEQVEVFKTHIDYLETQRSALVDRARTFESAHDLMRKENGELKAKLASSQTEASRAWEQNTSLTARLAIVVGQRDDIQANLESEQLAHNQIASICFKSGANTSDGTSVSAVKGLIQKLALSEIANMELKSKLEAS